MFSYPESEAGPCGAPPLPSLAQTIAVSGWVCPGGGEVRAPMPADPHWRGPDGRARSLGDVLAGQSEELRGVLLEAHGQAIALVVRAAVEAKLAGAPFSARPHVAAASRLCRELIGQG